ncbi:MAG: hypothetical protein EOO62_20650 [Hymenobacter sp.]|nr:MAG: hypothetical protein EOO62_20650 [Hymenobacter sp.]
MRKLAILVALGLASASAHAQTPLTKGRGLLTGSINYHHDGGSSTRYGFDAFSFSPAVGVFVADNFVVGANLTIQTASYSQYNYAPVGAPISSTYNSTAFAVGPFVRYYRFVGGDKFALFGQGGLGYIRTRGNYSGNDRQGYLSITPGVAFFPVPRFGIEGSLRGINLMTDFSDTSTLDLGVSLRDFQLGAVYYFGK